MRILLAEDRASLRAALAESLGRAGYAVDPVADGASALERVAAGGYDLALFDLKLPARSGLELLEASKARWPSVPVVVLTAYGSVETAVAAMRAGAFDFLLKPVDPDHLLLLVSRALESERATRVEAALREDLSRHPAFAGIVGQSPALLKVQEEARRVAPTDATVLLLGETGVGKELFARAVHAASPRAAQPFVAVNCAAIPAGLLENELFGHEKGAYTGAHDSRMGKFELAHRGTLFLDEIGEMHPELQAKLLRVLEERTFLRVGGVRPVTADVRLLCATNQDLEARVASGAFRRDLYYRISAFPLWIPPLRERPGDMAPLTGALLARLSRELGRRGLALDPAALAWAEAQPWPGNVRELANRLERAAILAGADGRITAEGLGAGAGAPAGAGPAPPPAFPEGDAEAWLEAEARWRCREVVRRCGGDRRRAARLLGMSPTALQRALEGPGEPGP
jgi:DNA-binding NtrC family response regulator